MRLLVIGGSDAGISAGLRAKEVAPETDVVLVVADAFPNFSICGIPYHVAGEVPDWRDLAHRTRGDLEAAGLELLLEHPATSIDPIAKRVTVSAGGGVVQDLGYDRLLIATGALPTRPPIAGIGELGASDGVHLLHTMGDTFAITSYLAGRDRASVVIVGAGYIGLEMAEALTHRGLKVSVIEQLGQVLPRTVDPELASIVEGELASHGVDVQTSASVQAVGRAPDGRLHLEVSGGSSRAADMVLVAVGVRPDTALGVAAGATLGAGRAFAVDRGMRTNLPDVFAAGDCAQTHHRLLLEPSYMPLGTTAHKQGRVAGENAVGGNAEFAGSLGTQVVRVFDEVIAATGFRDDEARRAGFEPVTIASVADDHKSYYPGATPIQVRITGDATSGRLLGAQLVGRLGAEIAKRIDVLAAGIYYGAGVEDLNRFDLSYTPPLGSPWDAIQLAAQRWTLGSQSLSRSDVDDRGTIQSP